MYPRLCLEHVEQIASTADAFRHRPPTIGGRMQVLYSRCAGLDVHKDSVFVCVRWISDDGKGHEEVRSFGTTWRQLLALGDWLAEQKVGHAAMESTGVYWKPIWNLLEDRVKLILVNAQHIKQVPGRKTDVKDCQWIAQLLQHGLLKASFVPDRPQRELRDLTRQRVQLMGEIARAANRIQKVLEDANIKLGSVVSDVMGLSGRDMLMALIAGNTSPAAMAQLARGQLRMKIPALEEALSGKVTEHHRFMLKALLDQVHYLEQQVEAFDQRIEEVMTPFEQAAVARLDSMPGVNVRAAQNILAEIGHDMSRFASEDHLASWAGICPGNNQSAGKRRSGKITRGNRWLKRTLAQCAWAASRKKDSFLSARYKRLSKRRGGKRAAVAVAHSQLTAIYHMLSHSQDYHELGSDYFDHVQGDRIKRHLVTRLERLGYQVELVAKPKKDAA
jgi:transposase